MKDFLMHAGAILALLLLAFAIIFGFVSAFSYNAVAVAAQIVLVLFAVPSIIKLVKYLFN